jgi:hypothetical protein
MNSTMLKKIIKEELNKVLEKNSLHENDFSIRFTDKVVIKKVVESIPDAAQLLPKRYKSDKAKLSAHNEECNKAKYQISTLGIKIRERLKEIGLEQPTHFMRSSDTSQMIAGGKFVARNEFYVYNQDDAQKIFDIAAEESPNEINVEIIRIKNNS